MKDNMAYELYVFNEFINHDITYEELSTIISRLKNNKAVCIDGIPNEILKYNGINVFY